MRPFRLVATASVLTLLLLAQPATLVRSAGSSGTEVQPSAKTDALANLHAVPPAGVNGYLRPTTDTCVTTNCNPYSPSKAVWWLAGETQLGAQPEALINLGWYVGTGAGNSQKPAVFFGAGQGVGAGSVWSFNTDVVRGCFPKVDESRGPHQFSGKGLAGSCDLELF